MLLHFVYTAYHHNKQTDDYRGKCYINSKIRRNNFILKIVISNVFVHLNNSVIYFCRFIRLTSYVIIIHNP